MSLTPEQIAFFDLFGYLVLPGAFREEIAWIDEEFERIVNLPHFKPVPFIDHTAKMSMLLDHPVILDAAEALLGKDFNYMLGDGGLLRGETTWHSDGSWTENPELRKAKFICYLDVVDANSGCLRVIPGSHRVGSDFAETLERLAWELMRDPNARSLGTDRTGWPNVALQTRPGDLIIFNHHLKHASFFGGIRRRFFDLNLVQHASTQAQIEQFRKYMLMHIAPWSDQVYGEQMLSTASPSRMTHLSQALEHRQVIIEVRSAEQAIAAAAS
jgi:ectoine hydroxylase-related dioxygenase (phytanoyl-CoA dioxygenase family)